MMTKKYNEKEVVKLAQERAIELLRRKGSLHPDALEGIASQVRKKTTIGEAIDEAITSAEEYRIDIDDEARMLEAEMEDLRP
jgi:hypothetical protein